MKVNTVRPPSEAPRTSGGAVADRISNIETLRRTIMAHMLWEDSFYEEGEKIIDRIKRLIPLVPGQIASSLAIEARERFGLRHVPLLIASEMCKYSDHRAWVSRTLVKIITRVDQMAEFLAIYWKDGKKPIAKQAKLGLQLCFHKFNEYEFAKYQGLDKEISLRDVMFMIHPRPQAGSNVSLFKKIADRTLATPDTWEVALSSADGVSKAEKWTRLLTEKKLGALALIRNLRNMREAGVEIDLIRRSLSKMYVENVYPFQFLAAAQVVPLLEPDIEKAMFRSITNLPKLSGTTVIIVDVSGSMTGSLSSKSDMSRLDASAAMASLIREVSENAYIFATAGSDARGVHATELIPARHGFSLMSEIKNSLHRLGCGGIFLTQAMAHTKSYLGLESNKRPERVIVITDEADTDRKLNPSTADAYGLSNYIINVGTEQNGIGYGKFTHITGFSQAIIHYLVQAESLN